MLYFMQAGHQFYLATPYLLSLDPLIWSSTLFGDFSNGSIIPLSFPLPLSSLCLPIILSKPASFFLLFTTSRLSFCSAVFGKYVTRTKSSTLCCQCQCHSSGDKKTQKNTYKRTTWCNIVPDLPRDSSMIPVQHTSVALLFCFSMTLLRRICAHHDQKAQALT